MKKNIFKNLNQLIDQQTKKAIREVLQEFVSTRTAAGAKKKGYQSPERKTKKTAYDTKTTAAATKKTAYDTKKSAYDTKKSDYDTKKAAQDASKAATNYDTKKSALTSATNTYNTKNAALKTHLDNEPTGAKKETTQYSYTNTVTGKKVSTATNPGSVGSYTIPAVGGGNSTTINKGSSEYWAGIGLGDVDAGETKATKHKTYLALTDAIKKNNYKKGSKEATAQAEALKTLQ